MLCEVFLVKPACNVVYGHKSDESLFLLCFLIHRVDLGAVPRIAALLGERENRACVCQVQGGQTAGKQGFMQSGQS